MMMLLPSTTATPCSPSISHPSERLLPAVVASDRDDDGFVASADVHPHDVLLLASSSSSSKHEAAPTKKKKHAGNCHYEMLVRENLDRHHQLSSVPRHQQLLCRSLVLAVRAQDPPGRFLAQSHTWDGGKGDVPRWVSVDDAQATEATARMFEEEAAKARR
jgi:hypothetical protein